ncbi:hypothetical protein Z949_3775 [Sulfitobacter guttiformis KCTC 32187]|nr:hypothetical protein Z949_3775 [Sulfitobacter guttiformis KCTC 32187]
MKTPRQIEKIVNFTKLFKNSKIPSRPNLFLAFEMMDMRLSFGSSLLGAKTHACCANSARITPIVGNANIGAIPQAIDCMIAAAGTGSPLLKKSGARFED